MTKIKVLCGFKERAGGPWLEYAPGWVLAQDRDCRDYDRPVVFDEMPVKREGLAERLNAEIERFDWYGKDVRSIIKKHVRRGLRVS